MLFVSSPFELFRPGLEKLKFGLLRRIFRPVKVAPPEGKSNYVNYQLSLLQDVYLESGSFWLVLLSGQLPDEMPCSGAFVIAGLELVMISKRKLEQGKGKQNP